MASKLTNCKSCGKEVAISAKTCPNCGAKVPKPVYKKWWFWVIIIFVFGGIINASSDDSSSSSSNNSTPETTAKVAVVETTTTPTTSVAPTVVSADEMLDLLDENALKAEKTYNGMYVEVTGVLSNIDSDGKYFSLTRNDGELTFINVMCYMDKEFVDTVMEFKMDQTVTVIGKIKSVGEVMGYSLDVEEIK